jgi:hypothetical protein
VQTLDSPILPDLNAVTVYWEWHSSKRNHGPALLSWPAQVEVMRNAASGIAVRVTMAQRDGRHFYCRREIIFGMGSSSLDHAQRAAKKRGNLSTIAVDKLV